MNDADWFKKFRSLPLAQQRKQLNTKTNNISKNQVRQLDFESGTAVRKMVHFRADLFTKFQSLD